MMPLAEYFAKNRYQGIYSLGDRVEGKYKGIPFIGSAGSDSIRNEDEGPHVTVLLDLPLVHEGKVHNVIRVPTDSVRLRK